MSGQDHHFPTFRKAVRVVGFGAESGGLASWISRTVLNERGLLRLALYAMLFICVAHIATIHVVMLQSGSGWTLMRNPGWEEARPGPVPSRDRSSR